MKEKETLSCETMQPQGGLSTLKLLRCHHTIVGLSGRGSRSLYMNGIQAPSIVIGAQKQQPFRIGRPAAEVDAV